MNKTSTITIKFWIGKLISLKDIIKQIIIIIIITINKEIIMTKIPKDINIHQIHITQSIHKHKEYLSIIYIILISIIIILLILIPIVDIKIIIIIVDVKIIISIDLYKLVNPNKIYINYIINQIRYRKKYY